MNNKDKFELHKDAAESLLKQAYDAYLAGLYHEVHSLTELASVHATLAFTEWTDS